MSNHCQLRIEAQQFDALINHLFPGDSDEHGAVLLAGASVASGSLTLLIREVHIAREGVDYVEGKVGYRALAPTFIHRLITRARDERLVYLAVHNHIADSEVRFSHIDLQSHERGYPALLQIAKGMPVGALVLGRRSMQADVWLPDGARLSLKHATVVGNTIRRLTPSPQRGSSSTAESYDRQIRMFGKAGQARLADCRVGIIGLGGIGSLIAEYLSRLGVGEFCLVDDDSLEVSNLSRVVGATMTDAQRGRRKVEVAQRLIQEANNKARVELILDDAAKSTVAPRLASCDYLFLAADSMRARLVFNAIVHQYLIPGVQLGAKVRFDPDGRLLDVMSANRPVRPGRGCLWCNQLIDAAQLAREAKTDEERKAQAYGVEEPNPSVITLNAVAASQAANDFLLNYLCLRENSTELHYEHYHFLNGTRTLALPRKDVACPECSLSGTRYARGDMIDLPCIDG